METEGMLAQYFCRITRDMLVMSSGLYKQLVLNENGETIFSFAQNFKQAF